MHITARIAWHNDGWNGRVCRAPQKNTFCIGQHSYPGDMIAQRRDVQREMAWQGKPCPPVQGVAPCIYSVNAFGDQTLTAYADPPAFFDENTKRREWVLPPSTVCVWPYEEMYRDDVRAGAGYDNDARLRLANDFFSKVERDTSLIFYYANYSNPFSTDDTPRYVLVGLSRVKAVGEPLFYEGANEDTKRRFGGAFVWDRNIQSHYPDQGLRLPYHLYRDDPRADEFALFPENPLLCKYGSKLLSDDEALGLVEQFLTAVDKLIQLEDDTENWAQRRAWLEGLISELWQRRGAYPGLPEVCGYLEFHSAVSYLRRHPASSEARAAQNVWSVIEGTSSKLGSKPVTPGEVEKVHRRWRLLENEDQVLLKERLPRLDLNRTQISRLLGADRSDFGVSASSAELAENPYLLAEQYVGSDSRDRISWSTVDRGMIPSPHLPVPKLFESDAPQRLRALVYETLLKISGHTFVSADEAVRAVNARLNALPEWKRLEFRSKYFEVDASCYAGALHISSAEEKSWVYRRDVYNDERAVEQELLRLLRRPALQVRIPMTSKHWHDLLFRLDSPLAAKAATEYGEAIAVQAAKCHQLFTRAFSVLCGAAGTGKTTVLRSIISAIRKVDGVGASVTVLAPTGKAADRAREMFELEHATIGAVQTSTIHAFLARRGWLNDNLTFKRAGGEQETKSQTVIIDECSMIDLQLLAALTRAIKWPTVKRLILVGDPNQLPPIGIGRPFADVVDYCRQEEPDAVAELTANLRQLEARATGKGTGIVALAGLYRQASLRAEKDEGVEQQIEDFLKRIQAGGDVDADLRVLYWSQAEELADVLVERLALDMAEDADIQNPQAQFYELWDKAFQWRPEYAQILSPYRGELYGIEALNRAIQNAKSAALLEQKGALDGITFFDKVIQIRNRTASAPLFGYDFKTRQTLQVDVFNGELGFAGPHGFDSKKWRSPYFRISRLAVAFARKGDIRVNYGRDLGTKPNGKHIPDERVDENLELGYVISVHKAQGSEFDRIYVVIPASNRQLLSQELLYTALTRGKRHCTLLVERDVGAMLDMRRRERCWLAKINSSLLGWHVAPKLLIEDTGWYEAGKIHQALTGDMVRSKSEVIIANMLHERGIDFLYERPLYAPDGTMYLPDFTVIWNGEEYYWEHLGRLDLPAYKKKWEQKRAWYDTHFPTRLRMTEEGADLSKRAEAVIAELAA